MRLIKQIGFLILLQAFQSLLEDLLYESYFFLKESRGLDAFLEYVFRFSLYRFTLAVIPYVILMILVESTLYVIKINGEQKVAFMKSKQFKITGQ
jgi:hypothetical protein